jgi:hypothetical protein
MFGRLAVSRFGGGTALRVACCVGAAGEASHAASALSSSVLRRSGGFGCLLRCGYLERLVTPALACCVRAAASPIAVRLLFPRSFGRGRGVGQRGRNSREPIQRPQQSDISREVPAAPSAIQQQATNPQNDGLNSRLVCDAEVEAEPHEPRTLKAFDRIPFRIERNLSATTLMTWWSVPFAASSLNRSGSC